MERIRELENESDHTAMNMSPNSREKENENKMV